MIQFRHDILWVRAADGQCTPFDHARLAASILGAAKMAGHDDWWLAESVAAAVEGYAYDGTPGQIVSAAALAGIATEALRRLHYEEIAAAYAHRAERAEIRLDQIGAAFELDLFHQLDVALQDAAEPGTTQLAVHGLRSCVMQLRHARRWGAGCRQLADQIVDHVRQRVARSRPSDAAALRLAVMD
jgi:hypothetical protein